MSDPDINVLRPICEVAINKTEVGIGICDKDFIEILSRLRRAKIFIGREKHEISLREFEALSLGDLWSIFYAPNGRRATVSEWEYLEERTYAVFSQLTPAQRASFLMNETPLLILYLMISFLIASCCCILVPAILIGSAYLANIMAICYILWSLSLGGLGSLAFLSMNALSLQKDITFDLTKLRLLSLRTAVGCLFAIVLSVPFGSQNFSNFILNLLYPDNQLYKINQIQQAIWLLGPFIIGFSTSLVVILLNQLVRAMQAFFGVDRKIT